MPSLLELKGPGTPAVVVETVTRLGMADDVIIGSFQPELVREAGARAPIATSLLVRAGVEDPVPPTVAVGAAYAHLCWERWGPDPAARLTPALLGRLRGAGLGIILWHEERPEVIARLRGLPVDGVCGNRPELLRPLKCLP